LDRTSTHKGEFENSFSVLVGESVHANGQILDQKKIIQTQ
jgi:hypothetical protein